MPIGFLLAIVTAATSMRCTHANWVVLFTTLFNTFVLGLYATVENEQYSVKQLTELPFSRCCWSCLKEMYRNMPRWRTEVDLAERSRDTPGRSGDTEDSHSVRLIAMQRVGMWVAFRVPTGAEWSYQPGYRA